MTGTMPENMTGTMQKYMSGTMPEYMSDNIWMKCLNICQVDLDYATYFFHGFLKLPKTDPLGRVLRVLWAALF